MVALPATASQMIASLRAYINPQGPAQTPLCNYTSADSQTANVFASTPVTVAANTVGFQINFATLFPACLLPLFVAIMDITNPGVGYLWYGNTGASAAQKFGVGANGFGPCFIGDGATAPNPIYIDNPTNNALLLQVSIASN